jgi:hypothetical protein
MQFTKDIILKNVRKYGEKSFIGLNMKTRQPTIVNLIGTRQNITGLLRDNQLNTIKFDRSQKVISSGDVVEYNSSWATRLKTQGNDKDMFIAAANMKLVAVTNEYGKKKYDDIRTSEELKTALHGGVNIQAFVTAIRSDVAEIISCVQDAQKMAGEMIARSQSTSYTPKMIIRAVNKTTGDTAAKDILFVRSQDPSVPSGIDVKETMNHIARNEGLNHLLTASMKDMGVVVEIIPAVHINMSAISTSALIDKKLMKASRNGSLGVADWHFRNFAELGKDTFTPCVLNIGISPNDEKFHFAKSLDAIGEVGEKWSLSNVPTVNWNKHELEKISEYETSLESNDTTLSPGF